uniref:hypothetical protein n=1 Tax=Lactiplantibacillus plantarum TaxID=1590 RepID=UPI00273921FA
DQLLKDGFVVNTILKEADLFCPNSVRINFTIYRLHNLYKTHIKHLHKLCIIEYEQWVGGI